MATFTLFARGMHCNACEVLIETELATAPGVASVEASLASQRVTVDGDFGGETLEAIAARLTPVLEPFGYTLSTTPVQPTVRWGDFRLAIPAALGFIFLFVLLQKLGVVNFVNTDSVGYGTAFVIGLIASVSTCMAVVGGLVLSVSANIARERSVVPSQVLFHTSRLVSFFLFGGLIGALGSFAELGATMTLAMSLAVGLVMLVLGLNLIDVFPRLRSWQLALPKWFGGAAHKAKATRHWLSPVLLGIVTFVLPCGFTQSMQFYALTTGSFLSGGLTMFFFALGTLPVLALLGFSSFGFRSARQSSLFFKTAGLVVIFFGLFNLLNSLVGYGILPPLFRL